MLKNSVVTLTKVACLFGILAWVSSCKKDDTPTDPCANKTITITPTVTQQADPCVTAGSGRISVSAAGSTGFTFKVDNGAFQASGDFTNLTAGNHTITVKDGAGCEKTATIDVTAAPAGPKFAAVKALLQTRCASASCHGGTQSPNFTQDCNIVTAADRIKARAVDATPSQMPPSGSGLVQADKDKITTWITGGKKFTD